MSDDGGGPASAMVSSAAAHATASEPDVPATALVAARAADAKQGERTTVLAMGELLVVTDAFVVTSGRNTRQVKTIVDEVEAQVKRQTGISPRRVEGLGDLQWVLMDYGDMVVHVFLDDTRDLYDLERLWGDAPRVEWSGAVAGVSSS
ncbi:MAG: ribosome silencing factor [Actinomycetota bacterium]|nr:ribosome silencing factor [Actinomycetota bacterium]